MSWRVTAGLLLLLALVVFSVQNYVVVEVAFLWWSFTTSRAILIFTSMAMGLCLGWLWPRRRS